MSLKRRLVLPLAFAGLVGLVGLLLLIHSSASATAHMSYQRLSPIQKRLASGMLAQQLGPSSTAGAPGNDDNNGVDGAPFAPPKSFASAGNTGGIVNYTPGNAGNCSANLQGNVKVNQNCLNIADSTLQGRSQANNEESIAQNPLNPRDMVASDNNYIRGDGTCGAYFSTNGGHDWSNVTTPNGFTVGPTGFAREYWQAGGDTSVAWDSRGNAYLSCQLFNRGAGTSPNPDQSSTFVIFRSTQNGGASFNFTGRYSTVPSFDSTGTSGVLVDKALMTVDNNPSSPFRDRIYVTWTQFAADASSYIYEAHSDDYGQTFSSPVVVSTTSAALCTNTFGAGTPQGTCNENQFSDPFVGPDGSLYVAFNNFNNTVTGSDNRNQVLLAKSTDGGQTFSAPVKVSDYYDLPDCNTYQGANADSFRACVPEKGSSTISVFRATNYPSGQVDPKDPSRVVVTFGSYINQDSNESNGCIPAGFASNGDNAFTGVKTPGACNNKILVSVSNDGGSTFTGTTTDPRDETLVTQAPGQNGTDQFWQWSAFTPKGQLAVDYYDRQYGNDETTGASDISLSGSSNLTDFGTVRVTKSSMPAPSQFPGAKGGQFMGDYIGMSALDQAHPIWSDTRSTDLFVCPGTAMPGVPPALCTGTEGNGETANDEESFTASLGVPNGHHDGH
jgi:hypothetical protein